MISSQPQDVPLHPADAIRATATAKHRQADALRTQAAALDAEAVALEALVPALTLPTLVTSASEDGLLTLIAAAEFLAVKPDTLRKWAAAGRIASVKSGCGVCFQPADIEAFVAERRRPTTVEVARRVRGVATVLKV